MQSCAGCDTDMSSLVYIHFVGHLGLMAVSQIPTCTILAMKSHYSPFQAFLGLSHEDLDPYHRILGRIIILLATAHGAGFILFFFMNHITAEPGKGYVVVVGIGAVYALWTLGIFSLQRLRRSSYKLFLAAHHAMFWVALVLLAIHVAITRGFVMEAVAIYVLNQLLRRGETKVVEAEVEWHSDSKVVKVEMTLQHDVEEFPPGSSAWISKWEHPKVQSLFSGYFGNPFTVDYDSKARKLTAYMRKRGKRTTGLSSLPSRTVVAVEGPYGSASLYEPSLSAYLLGRSDRVLLVAGGIGATFVFSVAHGLLKRLQDKSVEQTKKLLRVIWVAHNKKEMSWAESLFTRHGKEHAGACLADVVEVYYSRPGWNDTNPDLSDLVEEDDENVPLKSVTSDALNTDTQEVEKARMGRPDIEGVVSEFITGDVVRNAVAVAACGPPSLRRSVKREVHSHLKRGTKVLWHEEHFGE